MPFECRWRVSVVAGAMFQPIAPLAPQVVVNLEYFAGLDRRSQAIAKMLHHLAPVGVVLRVAAEAVFALVGRKGVVEAVVALLEKVGVEQGAVADHRIAGRSGATLCPCV